MLDCDAKQVSMGGVDSVDGSFGLVAVELAKDSFAGLLSELAAFQLPALLLDAAPACFLDSLVDRSGSLLVAELDGATSGELLCELAAFQLPIPDCCLDSLVDRSGRLLAAELNEATSAGLICELPAFQSSAADGPAVPWEWLDDCSASRFEMAVKLACVGLYQGWAIA